MGVTAFTGPLYSYGNMGALASGAGSATPDPNPDAGPSVFFQGHAQPDVRYPYLKNSVNNRIGVVPMHYGANWLAAIDAQPYTASTSNIVASANATAAALVLVTASTVTTATGAIVVGVPIIPQVAATPAVFGLNSGTPITTALILDFGFDFGTVTSASKTIVVLDSSKYTVGMPLVIPDVGAASAGTPLLTYVTSITDATHIVVNNAPLRSLNPAVIGTGNIWNTQGTVPTAHLPYIAAGIGGPGLFMDPVQSLSRNLQYTAAASATATTFTAVGYDMYWQPQTETVNVSAGNTVQGVKTFKAVVSVTLDASDATHAYSVGTGDIIGLPLRSDAFDLTQIVYNSAVVTAVTGYVAAVLTSPATATTGDVRGTYALQTASNGAVSALAKTGRRLTVNQRFRPWNAISGFPASPQQIYGVTPV